MERSRPFWLQAAGNAGAPKLIDVEGVEYALERIFKNDFFALTAVYRRGDSHNAADAGVPPERVLLKIGRTASMFGLPLRWTGRLLARKEEACLRALADLPGIPRFICRREATGVVREFVEGAVMRRGAPVPDGFHRQLGDLVAAIHDRGMAYVDLDKCENVLIGVDGRPHLFDFQIAWYWPRRYGGALWPVRVVRSWFQRGDLYHLSKLKRRTRPDQMSEEELRATYWRPWCIRLHRTIARPLTLLRRALLARLDPTPRHGERGRVEDGRTAAGPPCPESGVYRP